MSKPSYAINNINVPLEDFSAILRLVAEEHGNVSIEELMEELLLQGYIDRYKAGELELDDYKRKLKQEIFEEYLKDEE